MQSVGDLVVHRQVESHGATEDLHIAMQLLDGTRRYMTDPDDPGGTGPMIRIYRPEPTVAFGQRDRKLPGFSAAQQACLDLGFTPVVRRAGGRATAYHRGSLVIDHIEPDPDPIRESHVRFREFGTLLSTALNAAGIAAQVGAIPGEYCYGEHSVHARNVDHPDIRIKVIGTAQRQISTGWLFSSSMVIEDGGPIRRVLSASYEQLGLEWDPLTAGAASDLEPGITVEDVETAVLSAYARHWNLSEAVHHG